MMRQCGDCQLCCRLLPVPPLGKKAGERCQHQKFKKGCAVYRTAAMPTACAVWNCRWLVNDDAAELGRPDRVHYVIDIMPDFVSIGHDGSAERQHIQVVQVWCDPKHPEAHRDPALRRWLHRRAEQGVAAIIRFDARDALILFAPPLAHDGAWHEVRTASREQTHSLSEIVAALAAEPAPGI
jgi:hypothetical protein